MLTATLLIALMGCTTSSSSSSSVCAVELSSAAPATPLPGEPVVLSAGPLTTTFDTVVQLDGQPVPVEDVARTGCDLCDSCRETYSCAACGDCDSCDNLCEQTCIETVSITLPAATAPGSRRVQVFNAYGSSDPLSLEVMPTASDTGDTGRGGSDSGG